MSPGVRRARTLRTLTQRVNAFGQYHPATFAAYARAFVAWNGRVKPPALDPEDVMKTISMADGAPAAINKLGWLGRACPAAYTTAQLRAYGAEGWSNRHRRKRERRRAAADLVIDEYGNMMAVSGTAHIRRAIVGTLAAGGEWFAEPDAGVPWAPVRHLTPEEVADRDRGYTGPMPTKKTWIDATPDEIIRDIASIVKE